MKKNLAILIVLVIGLVVFQGLVGFNQKQELLAKLLGKAMVEVTTESTEFNLKTQEDISKLKEDVYKSYVKENSLIDRYLPNYSELNIIEIIVNIGIILGIVYCLISIRNQSVINLQDEIEFEESNGEETEDESDESIEENYKIPMIQKILFIVGTIVGVVVGVVIGQIIKIFNILILILNN